MPELCAHAGLRRWAAPPESNEQSRERCYCPKRCWKAKTIPLPPFSTVPSETAFTLFPAKNTLALYIASSCIALIKCVIIFSN
jgi:hypothetical protein